MEKIINKILEDAKIEANKIINQAKNEAYEDETKAFKELKNEKDRIMEVERKKIEYSKENQISMTQLEARKMILEEKHNCINMIKTKISDYIDNLSGKEYVDFICKALDTINLEGENNMIVLPQKQREDIIQELSKRKIKIQETGEFKSGFLLYKGTVEYDFNLDTIMQEQKDKIEEIIVKKIF